jgi:anti-sigma regulatory factor (Ser/Thr protein kinase)
MGAGGSRTRSKLFASLAVLGLLWIFAALAAGGDAADLFRARAAGEHIGQPTDAIILALQEERRLSAVHLGGGGPQSALVRQRARTDDAHAALDGSVRRGWVRQAVDDEALQRADELLRRMTALRATRSAVDARRLDRERAAAEYGATIDVAFRVYLSPGLWKDAQLTDGGQALIAISRAREALAREDALVRGALTAGGLTENDRLRLARLVGAQQFLRADAEAVLPAEERTRYQRLAGGDRGTALRAMEDNLIRSGGDAPGAGGTNPPDPDLPNPDGAEQQLDAQQALQAWTQAAEPVLTGLRDLESTGAREAVDAATPGAVSTIVRAGLVVGLGLVAVIAVFVLGLRAARAARKPDDDPEPASDDDAPDAEQTLNTLLRDLGRRNQALLHRQLRVLDAMERRTADDADLRDLFRADHLATRMRRNVEKSITLAGGTPGRRWRRPVPLIDVVRGAAAEVADYPRVATSQIEPAGLAGVAVTDVMHLLAELIENATSFAAAETRVRVSGAWRADGYAVTVEDAGPGMTSDDVATAHEVMNDATPPDGGAWWGLYSVGRFADRHGIAVTLRPSASGGLAAEVLIPSTVLVEAGRDATAPQGVEVRDGNGSPARSAGPGGLASPFPGSGGGFLDGAQTTASGLPTRVRNATDPAAPKLPTRTEAAQRTERGHRHGDRLPRQTDRVARLRDRARRAPEGDPAGAPPDPVPADADGTVADPATGNIPPAGPPGAAGAATVEFPAVAPRRRPSS